MILLCFIERQLHFIRYHFPFVLSLVQPFWQVVNYLDSRGRGVVGKKLRTLEDLLVFEVRACKD